MTVITFNAITYANKLKEAGMQAKVADVQAEEMVNIIGQSLATRDDLKMLELTTKSDLLKMKNELEKFIVRTITTAIFILGGLQTLFHFLPQ